MFTNIEAERARLKLKQEEVAQKLGITGRTYANYVTEKTPIPSDVLIRMTDLFSCSIDYLLGLKK